MKDCDCLDSIHDGPHWLYMDRVAAQQNVEIFDAMLATSDPWMQLALWRQFCAEEVARMGIKQRRLSVGVNTTTDLGSSGFVREGK